MICLPSIGIISVYLRLNNLCIHGKTHTYDKSMKKPFPYVYLAWVLSV